jgi:hypothetical protein
LPDKDGDSTHERCRRYRAGTRALECGGLPQDRFAVANLTPLLQWHAIAILWRNSLVASPGCLQPPHKATAWQATSLDMTPYV